MAKAKRRKKYKPQTKVVCKYCLFFYKSVERTGTEAEGHKRFCRAADDWMEVYDDACVHFTPVEIFWCDKNQYWLKISVCIHRRKNTDKYDKYAKCSRCNQRKIIDKILEEEFVVVSKVRKLKKLRR